jgi:predicted DNA-binding protein with PD1-like motif
VRRIGKRTEMSMRSKLVHEAHGHRTFVVVLDIGDEIRECISSFAKQQRLSAAQVTAIGAFQRATIRFYDWETKEYLPIPVEEQVEVVSLNGDIALDKAGKPKLHLHAMLGRRDGSAMGGDLKDGIVRPTLEVIITESAAHLRRVEDPETGLSLIRIDYCSDSFGRCRQPGDLGEDAVCRLGPDEGARGGVVLADVASDGLLEIDDGLEGTAS